MYEVVGNALELQDSSRRLLGWNPAMAEPAVGRARAQRELTMPLENISLPPHGVYLCQVWYGLVWD